MLLERGPAHVFDTQAEVATQIAVAQPWGGQPFLPDLYPPFWVLAHAWLALLPIRWAYLAWGGLTIAASIAALFLIAGSLPLGARRRWVIVVAAGFLPLTVNLVQGQSVAFVILAMALALRLWTAGRDGLAGLALGLVLIKPQLGVLLVALPVVHRSGRALTGLVVSVLALAGVSLAVFGVSGLVAWVHLVTDQAVVPGAGAAYRPWLSLRGPLAAAGMPDWVQYGLLLSAAGALLVALLWRPGDIGRDFAIATAGALLVTPHVNIHDLAVLVLPGVVLASRSMGVVAAAYVGATAAIWLAPGAWLASLALIWLALSRPDSPQVSEAARGA